MPVMPSPSITDLNDRSREIFRVIVDSYVETGEPVGSRTLARKLGANLSPATIRNVMADLQDMGLLYSPHTSAGRLPTDAGLRLFVNGLLEVGNLTDEERRDIEARCTAAGRSYERTLENATEMLSGLASSVGLVIAPKTEATLAHIEFVPIGQGRAIVVMVDSHGHVENRVVDLPPGLPGSALVQASNYLQSRLAGRTLAEARSRIVAELAEQRAQLDALTQKVVEEGLAVWAGDRESGTLIIKGQARLLEDVNAIEDLERIRSLFSTLETRESMLKLVEAAEDGEGVHIFIGSENHLFSHVGWSMIMAPYGYGETGHNVVGAIGVIGPTRLNYARIIPMVDYTAKLIGRLLG
jgi:heat-inducible transcriptional repressor